MVDSDFLCVPIGREILCSDFETITSNTYQAAGREREGGGGADGAAEREREKSTR